MRQKTELCKLETEYFYLGGFLISIQYQQTQYGPDLGCAMCNLRCTWSMVISMNVSVKDCSCCRLSSLICADCIPFPAVSKSLVWAVPLRCLVQLRTSVIQYRSGLEVFKVQEKQSMSSKTIFSGAYRTKKYLIFLE